MRRTPRTLLSLAACFLSIGSSAAPAPVPTMFPASNEAARLTREPLPPATTPSRFGIPTSRRWSYGAEYQRQNLPPVPNPNPSPEPQPLREHPYDVALSSDGTKVYVALQGTELQPMSEVAVYDLREDKVTRRISLKPSAEEGPPGSSPYRLSLHPGGRYLLVTNRFSNFVSVIDTHTDTVTSEIPLDFYAQGMTFDEKGETVYFANRYLDQVLVADIEASAEAFSASQRIIGALDDKTFFGRSGKESIHKILDRRCGTSGCHDQGRGGFVVGDDPRESFLSVLEHVTPGNSEASRLLRATVRTQDGGYANLIPKFQSHNRGTVVFPDPDADPDYRALADWIDSASPGPGIPVGNPRSKPKVCALTSDGRYLIVGNTGTQDVSIVDTRLGREVGAIYIQNVVNDLAVFHSEETGHDYLIVVTEGIGFGVVKERDPYGGESWDSANPAAHYSLWRNVDTAAVLPKDEQVVLGPFDAVDGTAAIKFRDIQNDIVFIDLTALDIPENPPPGELEYLLLANKYESHKNWVRYTSDTAESTYGDIKGDVPPDLMRVVGAFPEKISIRDDRLFITMQGSNQIQELRINPTASDPSDYLVPLAVYPTGLQPIGIKAGKPDTPSEGLLFVSNFLSGTLSIVDTRDGTVREAVIDPSVERLPVPSTNAERGEVFAHTSVFSSDGDTSCFHCHYLDMGDGRPWGVSQVLAQEFLSEDLDSGQLTIAGTMGVPQMRGLFETQPFFFEGVISVFEPRSMMMEHNPSDDFTRPGPPGDYTGIEAHYAMTGVDDVQSRMKTTTRVHGTLEERRDTMFRRETMRLFGKAYSLRDFQRFVGEWQVHEPRLLPNPFDPTAPSVLRGKLLFEDPQIGCVSCHPPPSFAKKDLPDNRQQSFASQVTFTMRDGAFTLIGMNRLDAINGVRRDLEPWDIGRAEENQGHFTPFPLRGIWDRPPVFLHNGMARTLREVLAVPGHRSLGEFKYAPLMGGVSERPEGKEVGFNMTYLSMDRSPKHIQQHIRSGARIGFDTHGGTSHLTAPQIDDLVTFMMAIE